MPPASLVARAPESDTEWQAYYRLRWEVLRQPWHQPRGSERDDFDDGREDVVHRMVFERESVWAVGRLHVCAEGVGQVRYMAVSSKRVGGGLGSIVLRALESAAVNRGLNRIMLNAREGAVPFYRKHHYETTGAAAARYEIPHWVMEKQL
ncbi:MAG: hypothetical protein SynsKO_02700 [Synoicihabitans sp.]